MYAFALLFCVGIATIIHYESMYGAFVPFLMLLSRRAVIRVVIGFIFGYLIVPFLPDWMHEALVKMVVRFDDAISVLIDRLRGIWGTSSIVPRILLTIAGAGASAIIIGILYVFHIRVGRIRILGPWLREKGFPFLARSATAQSVETQLGKVWNRLPVSARSWITWTYLYLWWRTVPPLVAAHQIFGKRKAFLQRRRRLRGAVKQRRSERNTKEAKGAS